MLTTHSERALVLALSMTLAPAATAGAGGPIDGISRPRVELAHAASVSSVKDPIRRADGALQRATIQIGASQYGQAKASLDAVRRAGRRAHVIAMSLIGAPPTDPESDDLPGPPAVLGVLALEHRIGIRVVELFDGMRRPGVVSALRRTLWTAHHRRNVMLDRVIGLPAEGTRVDYADGVADTLPTYSQEVKQVTTALQTFRLSPAGRVGLRRALHRVQATTVKVNRSFGGGE
jgi:hypothetical protein